MRWLYTKIFPPALFSGGIFQHLEDRSKLDSVLKDDDDETDEKWKKLKTMFSHDKYGSISPQMKMISEGSTFSFFLGFMIGGIHESKETFFKFVEENKATAFTHHLEAKRALQDATLISFWKGGFKLGWRICFITTSFIGIITSLNTYRGDSSVLDFITAGATTCGIYKLRQGPKPLISGVIVGGGLGALAGGVIVGLMKISGVTFQDIYQMDGDKIGAYNKKIEDKLYESRKEKLNENIFYRKESAEEDEVEETAEKEITPQKLDDKLKTKPT